MEMILINIYLFSFCYTTMVFIYKTCKIQNLPTYDLLAFIIWAFLPILNTLYVCMHVISVIMNFIHDQITTR